MKFIMLFKVLPLKCPKCNSDGLRYDGSRSHKGNYKAIVCYNCKIELFLLETY